MYVPSETTTQRSVFVRPPAVLKLPAGSLLRVERPLYGLPEDILYWYQTYYKYQVRKFFFKSATHGPLFLYTLSGMLQNKKHCEKLRSNVCLRKDNTADAGIDCFVMKKSLAAKRFGCKLTSVLEEDFWIKFNRTDIGLKNLTCFLF